MNPLSFALPIAVAVVLLVQAIVAAIMGRWGVTLGAILFATLVGMCVFAMFGLLLAAPAPEQITLLSNSGFVIAGLGAVGFIYFWIRLVRHSKRDKAP